MATALWSIGLVLLAALIGSLGPIFLKKGTHKIKDLKSVIFNFDLYAGIGMYVAGTILFIPALKGGELSVLYPIVATTYIWVSILSVKLLKENMNRQKWIGICLILVGVALIGIGS